MSQSTIEFIVIFVSILALFLLLVFYNSSKKSRAERDMPADDPPYRTSAYDSGGAGSRSPSGYGKEPEGPGGYRSGPDSRLSGSPGAVKSDSLERAGSLEKTSYVWSTGEEKYAGRATGESAGAGLKKGRFSSASTKKEKEEKILDSDIEDIYRFYYSKQLRICPFCGSENDVSNLVCESCKESLR